MRITPSLVQVAVGMPVTQHPPPRSRRAARPHRAPASGHDAQAPKGPAVRRRAPVTGSTRLCVRPLVCWTTFPLARSLPSTSSAAPVGQPWFAGFCGPLKRSDSLHPCLTVVPRTGSPCGPGHTAPGQRQGLPGSAPRVSVPARGLRPRRVWRHLARAVSPGSPSACAERVGPQK
jgi:hypothetical protein